MWSGRAALLLIPLLSVLCQSSSSTPSEQGAASRTSPTRSEGLAAWQQMYSVMSHPRCINCHTATDHPDQADDRHPHLFHVVRGPVNVGVPGLNCATCHQRSNADSTGVPGATGWHLAPLAMAWQDRGDKIFDSATLCRAVTDRKKNENMDGMAIVKHHADAVLVKWAWAPGRRADGTLRTTPSVSHEQFVAATRTWAAAGTPCP